MPNKLITEMDEKIPPYPVLVFETNLPANNQLPNNNIKNIELVGNFIFRKGNLIYDSKTFQPTREISFLICPETKTDAEAFLGEEKIIEMLAQRLKEDFISFMKNPPTDPNLQVHQMIL